MLASTLLGADPPELPVANLVFVAGLFGINENRARVALSRMAASGEVTTGGSGRYRLAGHLLQRQGRQQFSRSGRTTPWNGRWTTVVVTAEASSSGVRVERRRVLAFARLAELRGGVWLRPDNLEVDLSAIPSEQVLVARAEIDSDPRALATRLWDLEGWSDRARALVDELVRLEPGDVEDLAPGFELSASVLRHLQADPLLPAELLPVDWAGTDLRATYDTWDSTYRRLLARWTRTEAGGI